MYPCARPPRRRLEFCEDVPLAPDITIFAHSILSANISSVPRFFILQPLIYSTTRSFTHGYSNSPLRQPQQQLPLRPIRNEARNAEPAHRAVSILPFPSRTDSQRIPHQLLSIRRRKLLRLVRQSSDQMHLRQWARGRGREGASAKARELGAEGLHFRRRGA